MVFSFCVKFRLTFFGGANDAANDAVNDEENDEENDAQLALLALLARLRFVFQLFFHTTWIQGL